MATQTNYKVSDNGVERDANAAEIEAIEDNKRIFAADEAAKANLQAKKQEVLAKLGLTADEVTALLA
jgi:hypothetical protein